MPAFVDRTGLQYGRWVATRYAGRSMWVCTCQCGSTATIASRDLVAGKSTSCGCYRAEIAGDARRTHGRSAARVYTIWCHMRARCLNPAHPRYPLYGGRGITICDRWSSFENFYSDMGDPPAGTSLDRVDNSRGYSPDNCRWATQREQVHNSRSTKLSDDDVLCIRKDTRSLREIADDHGIGPTYACAIRRGKKRIIPE